MPTYTHAPRPPTHRSHPNQSCSVLTPAQPLLDLPVRRLPVRFESDVRRVIVRPFVMSNSRIRALFDRLQGLPEHEIQDLLEQVRAGYGDRHNNLDAAFAEHFTLGTDLINWHGDWSPARRALAGAYMTMEYSIDSAALFNPSIVPHPTSPTSPPAPSASS